MQSPNRPKRSVISLKPEGSANDAKNFFSKQPRSSLHMSSNPLSRISDKLAAKSRNLFRQGHQNSSNKLSPSRPPDPPITNLPPDVLIEVFTLVVFSKIPGARWQRPQHPHPRSPDFDDTLNTLSQVCRTWCGIIHSTPSLWSYITIARPSSRSARFLSLWLARSGTYPLTILIWGSPIITAVPDDIEVGEQDPSSSLSPSNNNIVDFDQLLLRLLQHFPRWRTIDVDLSGVPVGYQIRFLDHVQHHCGVPRHPNAVLLPLLVLQSINISLEAWDEDIADTLWRTLYMLPSLRKVVFRHYLYREPPGLTTPSSPLPPSPSSPMTTAIDNGTIPWAQLTSVTIHTSMYHEDVYELLLAHCLYSFQETELDEGGSEQAIHNRDDNDDGGDGGDHQHQHHRTHIHRSRLREIGLMNLYGPTPRHHLPTTRSRSLSTMIADGARITLPDLEKLTIIARGDPTAFFDKLRLPRLGCLEVDLQYTISGFVRPQQQQSLAYIPRLVERSSLLGRRRDGGEVEGVLKAATFSTLDPQMFGNLTQLSISGRHLREEQDMCRDCLEKLDGLVVLRVFERVTDTLVKGLVVLDPGVCAEEEGVQVPVGTEQGKQNTTKKRGATTTTTVALAPRAIMGTEERVTKNLLPNLEHLVLKMCVSQDGLIAKMLASRTVEASGLPSSSAISRFPNSPAFKKLSEFHVGVPAKFSMTHKEDAAMISKLRKLGAMTVTLEREHGVAYL